MTCDENGCRRPGPRGGPCSTCRKRKQRTDPEWHAKDAAYQRARYAANPDPVKARVASYRENNLEVVRERGRVNSRRYRAEHLEYMKAAILRADARWKAEHPVEWSLRNREHVRRRKLGPVPPADYAAILERDGMTCHLCGDPIASLADLEFDHVIPTVLGGEHTDSNIRPSHTACNRRKGGRPIP